MPRKCSVCVHPKRNEIDEKIVARESYRAIARQYGLSKDAVSRHAENHLPVTLSKSQEASDVAHADDLLGQVQGLKDKALKLLEAAEKAGDLRTALRGIREARGCMELLAKLLGELDESPKVNLLLTPQWVELRRVMFMALEPFPEARMRLAEVLSDGS